MVLRAFGARIGSPCDVRASARIWLPVNLQMEDWTMLAEGVICYNVAPVILRKGALVSQRAHLCTASHDIRDVDFGLIARRIEIGPQCWVAAEAFVGPGVVIGAGAVLGARAAAFENLRAWTIYRGNPAKEIRERPQLPMMQVSQREKPD